MRSSLLMWRRLFLMRPTTRENDHIFTFFYVSMTPVVVVQAQALVGELKLCQRRLSYAKHVDQHEDRNQPAFFPEERTSCSGCRNRWRRTPGHQLIRFSATGTHSRRCSPASVRGCSRDPGD